MTNQSETLSPEVGKPEEVEDHGGQRDCDRLAAQRRLIMENTVIAGSPLDIPISGWIDDRLPEPFDPKLKKPQAYLCYVVDEENIYGGQQMILFFGAFEFYDCEGVFPDADEDGQVKRFGWHYERDSEGDYDSLTFDMNGTVSHWMPLPDAPNVKWLATARP